MTEHRFGGPWTEIKLDAVEYYLTCYTKALRATSFDLWYIDAFAGSGERTVEQETGGLFERRPIAITTETLAGSARRALSVEPTFHHFVFIERDQKRCLALNSLKSEYPHRDIRCLTGEANDELKNLVRLNPWRRKENGPGRAVVFLDPYSLQVEWATLKALAETRVMDVWYLFPLRDVVAGFATFGSWPERT